MTIYVFSDSHGSTNEMIEIVGKNPPDLILHLGDVMEDAEDLASVYPQIPLYLVPGNCDGYVNVPSIQLLEVDGVSILFSHGHLWSVKRDFQSALITARKENADVVLFGHTHIAVAEQQEDGLWLMNPGSSPASYGIIRVEEGEIVCSLHASQTKEIWEKTERARKI